MKYQRIFKRSVMILGSVLIVALLGSCQEEGSETGADDSADGGSQSDIPEAGYPQPVIPEPSMRCPFFVTGTQEIMLLTVQMWVGEKNPKAEGALLFYWHGMGGVSSEAEALPETVKQELLSQGGIIVSPQDTNGRGNGATVGVGTWSDSDFEFTDLIAACAVRDHNINPRRIYSTGCSAGGLQTANMVFKRSSYLAAAVTNSGGLIRPLNLNSLQDPSHVPPVMTIHGSAAADVVVISFVNTSRTLDQSIVDLGGFAINCNHQGAHCGGSEQDYIAAWQFMKDHPFGVETEPYANALPSFFPQYCEIIR
jgi:poly(3-hydroxybutyrate) depolymerase